MAFSKCVTLMTILTNICEETSTNPSLVTEPTDIHLIVALPLQHGGAPTASWERGQEILPGAQTAINTINNRSDILPEHKLQVTEVDIGKCGKRNFNFFLQFINFTFSLDINFLGIVGVFCPFKTMQLSRTREIESAVKAAYAIDLSVSKLESGSTLVKAILEFFNELKWRIIGVITEAKSTFFSQLAEELCRKYADWMNGTVALYHYGTNIAHLSLPRIVFVSVSATSAIELLCSAYENSLIWPKHVWILHSYQLEDFHSNASCNVTIALENVLLFREEFQNIHELPQQLNSYSVWLHNAIWSIAIAVNDSLQNKENFHISAQEQISVVQVNHFNEIPIIALYSNKLRFINITFQTRAPSDKFTEVYEGGSSLYTVTMAVVISFVFIIMTVMLISYIHFRKEPEVKSTSFSLSLLLFLGCYLTLIYLSINVYLHQPIPYQSLLSVCLAAHFLSGLGLPSALILATVAVKMLRIYYIFNKNTPKQLSSKCSDLFLLVYVILILSPMILVYISWTLLDPYRGFYQRSTDLNIVTVQKGCTSTYLTVWQSILVVYMILLFLLLLVVALMMRKIDNPHFNDTKKVNILIVCLFLDLVVTLVTWRILYAVVKLYLADIVLHIGHYIFILSCQILLIVPKVFPPFVRCIKERLKLNY